MRNFAAALQSDPSSLPAVAVVLVEAHLWGRSTPAEGRAAWQAHADGPANGDVILVTGEPALAALLDGRLRWDAAIASGLVVVAGPAEARAQVASVLARQFFLKLAPEFPIQRGDPESTMKNTRPLRQLVASASVMLAAAAPLAFVPAGALAQSAPPGHHDPKGKPPSKFTLDVLERSRATLPFGDTRDFDEQKKGFIAPMKDLKIRADAGHVAWDLERYQFLLQKDAYDSIHPSLMRISRLKHELWAVRGRARHLPGPAEPTSPTSRSCAARPAGS